MIINKNEVNNAKTTTSYIVANRSNGSRTIITHVSKEMKYPDDTIINLENLNYTGNITANPNVNNTFVNTHSIVYGDINTAITNSSSSINDNNV